MRAGLLVMVLGVVTSDVAPEQAGRFTAVAREIAVDLDAAVGLAQAGKTTEARAKLASENFDR